MVSVGSIHSRPPIGNPTPKLLPCFFRVSFLYPRLARSVVCVAIHGPSIFFLPFDVCSLDGRTNSDRYRTSPAEVYLPSATDLPLPLILDAAAIDFGRSWKNVIAGTPGARGSFAWRRVCRLWPLHHSRLRNPCFVRFGSRKRSMFFATVVQVSRSSSASPANFIRSLRLRSRIASTTSMMRLRTLASPP